jgi:hypothetical protein
MALTASLLFVAFGAHLRQGGDQDRPGRSVEDVLKSVEDASGLPWRQDGDRGSPEGRPFADVLNVVLRPHYKHIDIFRRIEAKHKNFWGTVYVCPKELNEYEKFAKEAPTVLCDDIPGAAGDRSYLVLGPLLSSLYTGVASEERDKRLIEWILREGKFGGRNLAEIKGALIHHADFWVLPNFAAGMKQTNRIWHMEYFCSKTPDWEYEPKETIKRLEAVGKVSFKDEPLCYGESDLYYLSRETWPLASTLMTDGFKPTIKYEADGSVKKTLHNELAVPLLMTALKKRGFQEETICWENGVGLTYTGKLPCPQCHHQRLHRPKCCWGGAMKIANKTDYLRQNVCGHRLAMYDKNLTDVLVNMWTGKEPLPVIR